ncbi:hypothetical protein CHU98_g4814 [Xylaria longipes]|nr:hypothetical protein CHU98_g4814 [Xylaria longipes]
MQWYGAKDEVVRSSTYPVAFITGQDLRLGTVLDRSLPLHCIDHILLKPCNNLPRSSLGINNHQGLDKPNTRSDTRILDFWSLNLFGISFTLDLITALFATTISFLNGPASLAILNRAQPKDQMSALPIDEIFTAMVVIRVRTPKGEYKIEGRRPFARCYDQGW